MPYGIAKVSTPLASHSRRSARLRPSLTPKKGTSASNAAAATVKRNATPVIGGMPSRLTRIAAQVVPQIRISAASAAVVRRRVGFTVPAFYSIAEQRTRGLRVDPVQRPRIRDGLAEMGQARHPRHEALDAHAEAAVRIGAVLADVEIPLEGLHRQVVLADAREQQVVVVDPLTAADDLAVTLGSDQIEAEHEVRVLRSGLHVEGLEGGREPGHHHRLVVLAGEDGLLVAAEVVAPLDGIARAVEDLHRLGVGDAREGRHDLFELRGVALQRLEVLARAVEDAGREVADELLGEGAETVELEEGHLGLHHPELHEVTAGLRLLGAEGGAKAVDLAESGRGRLQIELSGLGKEGLVAEVIGLEERRGSLAGGGREDGRVDERELALVEEVADPLLDLATHPQGGALAAGAQPQVAVLHEERRAVLLGSDRVVLGEMEDLEALALDLDAGGRALVRLDEAGDANRRFLRHALDLRPFRLGHVVTSGHSLHGAAGRAHLQEGDLAAGALVVDPSRELDLLADVTGQLADRGDGDGLAHGGGIVLERSRSEQARFSGSLEVGAVCASKPHPPGPLSLTDEGGRSTTGIAKKSAASAARLLVYVPPRPSGRGGQGVRLRSADPLALHQPLGLLYRSGNLLSASAAARCSATF